MNHRLLTCPPLKLYSLTIYLELLRPSPMYLVVYVLLLLNLSTEWHKPEPYHPMLLLRSNNPPLIKSLPHLYSADKLNTNLGALNVDPLHQWFPIHQPTGRKSLLLRLLLAFR